jgi:alpha-galactosidase
MGGSLVALKNDPATLALLTNPEVIDVDQHSTKSRVINSPSQIASWISKSTSGKGSNVAIFNLQDKPFIFHFSPGDFDLQPARVRDLWQRVDLPKSESYKITLPAHGAVLYRVTPAH